GAFESAGDATTADALADRAGVLPAQRRLVRRWLDALADDGRLSRQGDRFVARTPLAVKAPPLDAEKAFFADYTPFLEYIGHAGPRLADILTGKESPLETLFPEGSNAL